MPLNVIQGDITLNAADAIVNSANPSLLAGGGVCGAIHRVAGPQLEAACQLIGSCKVGSAVWTEAFGLPAKWVIHAVGPRWLDGNRGEEALLRQCYESIFRVADEIGALSLSIPSISTGIYHYPLDAAAAVAASVSHQCHRPDRRTTFVCFDAVTLDAYRSAFGVLAPIAP